MSQEKLLQETKIKDKVERPVLAKVYFIIGISLQGIGFLCGKVCYQNHPTLGPCPFLVYRSGLCCILLVLFHNKNLKYIVYDSIDRSAFVPISIRVLTGNFSIFVNFMAVKYFTLSLVAMVLNTAPLMTFFFAMVMFKEVITISQVISLFAAFSGVLMMLFGGVEEQKQPEYTPTLIMYIVLLLSPVSNSGSQLAMRAMKKLNDHVVTAYMQLSLIFCFLPVCLIMNYNLSIIYDFGYDDLIAIFAASVANILSQTFRFIAIQNHPLSGLQPYTFVMLLQQFLTDMLLLNYQFTIWQWIGMQILVIVYISPLIYQCFK